MTSTIEIIPEEWISTTGTLQDNVAGILDCRKNPLPVPYAVKMSVEDFRYHGGPRWCELPPRHLLLPILVDTEEDKIVMHDGLAEKWRADIRIGPNVTYPDVALPYRHVLWRPTPLLEDIFQILEENTQPDKRSVIDLGCGSGRDCVYLAMRGWFTVGIDIVPKTCTRAQEFASRHHVTEQTEFHTVDIAELEYPENSFDLVIVARTYVPRSLWDKVFSLIAPGGYLLWHHFLDGCNHPTGEKLLKKGELREKFDSVVDIVIDEEKELAAPDNRPCSHFLCRKR